MNYQRSRGLGRSGDDIEVRGEYVRREDGMFRLRERKGEVEEIRLTNYTAEILRETVVDDGADVRRFLHIAARHAGRACEFDIPAESFRGTQWVMDEIGAQAITFPGGDAHARTAIQAFSESEQVRVFGHSGWRTIAGVPCFLHAGGAIGPDGPVRGVGEVRLPPSLAPLRLSNRVFADGAREQVEASLRLLEVAPESITLPLLAAVYRAVLSDSCPMPTLFLYGSTGAFKTALAALTQRHFGEGFDAEHLPGGWSSTENALEEILFLAKDVVCTVDDFVSNSKRDMNRIHASAERLLRNAANNQGRQRLRGDCTLRAARPPRGLILATGEEVPRGHSLVARTVLVEVPKGAVDGTKLNQAQSDARQGMYCAALSGFVRWVATDFRRVQCEVRRDYEQARDELGEVALHGRVASNVASLAAGWVQFLLFARSIGVVDRVRGMALWDRGWSALVEGAKAQGRFLRNADPVEAVLDFLAAALDSGRIRLGSAPLERGEIGWQFAGEILVPPQKLHEAMSHRAREGQDPIVLSRHSLEQRLADAGALKTELQGAERRLKVRRTVGGERKRVLAFEPVAVSGRGPGLPVRQ